MARSRTVLAIAVLAAWASSSRAGDRDVCAAMLAMSAQLTRCEVTRGPGDTSTYSVRVDAGRAPLDKDAIEREAARFGEVPGKEAHLLVFARTTGERAAIYAIRHDRSAAGVTVRLDDGRGPRLIRRETVEACGGFNRQSIPPADGDVTDEVLDCLAGVQPSVFTPITK